MSGPSRTIDLDFRPESYFAPGDNGSLVLSSIKGAERRAIVKMYFDKERGSEIPEELLDPSLSDQIRREFGSIHPAFMGGEYLPSLDQDEIEIARITIASTTQDVTSVYASRSGDQILLRVVDEYEGDTLERPSEKRTTDPLTLQELFGFFLGAWDLLGILDMNFGDDGHPPEEVMAFFCGSSQFYQEFDALLRQRVKEWLSPNISR